jgi:hypothetical protein
MAICNDQAPKIGGSWIGGSWGAAGSLVVGGP